MQFDGGYQVFLRETTAMINMTVLIGTQNAKPAIVISKPNVP